MPQLAAVVWLCTVHRERAAVAASVTGPQLSVSVGGEPEIVQFGLSGLLRPVDAGTGVLAAGH